MKSKKNYYTVSILTIALFLFSCSKDDSTTSSQLNPIPSVYSKIYGATSITSNGTFITIKTNDQPDHKSAYWANTNNLYEAFTPSATSPSFTGGAFIRAPNNITAQTITLKIPLNPIAATTHTATPMGVMGIALDGVPFF